MSDTKLLQAILDKVNNLGDGINRLEKKMDDGFNKVNARIDMLGEQLNEVDDDAPTGEEFNRLERRVTKLEQQANKN